MNQKQQQTKLGYLQGNQHKHKQNRFAVEPVQHIKQEVFLLLLLFFLKKEKCGIKMKNSSDYELRSGLNNLQVKC